jgi:carbon monoxide dehydrogenase subunit G
VQFENRFDVDAPLDRVWEAILDLGRVAPAVPGAQVLEKVGDDVYKVAMKVKVGPISMTYRGEVEIADKDEPAHRAVMKARAKETRGGGAATAVVTMELHGANGRTSARVTTDVQLSGKVASMGHGVIQDVSGRLIDTFADNLAAMLGAAEPSAATPEPGPPPPLDVGAVGGALVAKRLRQPQTLALVVAGALIAFVVVKRSRG